MQAFKPEDLYNIVSLGNLRVSGKTAVFARIQSNSYGSGYWNYLDLYQDGTLKRLTTLGEEKSFALVGHQVYYASSAVKGKTLSLIHI